MNQILTKLHSPLKTSQTDLSGNPLSSFPSTGMPGMPLPLTSIQGIQTLLNQVNSVQKEIKKDAEGPLLAPPKPELPDMQFFTGAEVKTEIPTFDEPKRTPKTIQKSAEIHKKLLKTKPVGIQLKPINKSPTVGPIGIAAGLSNAQSPLNLAKTKTQPANKVVTKTEKKQILPGKNLDLIGLKFKFFKCTQCDETFTSKELRDKHQLNNHFDCKGIFSTVSTYRVLIPEPM